jgi:hypothetical protein
MIFGHVVGLVVLVLVVVMNDAFGNNVIFLFLQIIILRMRKIDFHVFMTLILVIRIRLVVGGSEVRRRPRRCLFHECGRFRGGRCRRGRGGGDRSGTTGTGGGGGTPNRFGGLFLPSL